MLHGGHLGAVDGDRLPERGGGQQIHGHMRRQEVGDVEGHAQRMFDIDITSDCRAVITGRCHIGDAQANHPG